MSKTVRENGFVIKHVKRTKSKPNLLTIETDNLQASTFERTPYWRNKKALMASPLMASVINFGKGSEIGVSNSEFRSLTEAMPEEVAFEQDDFENMDKATVDDLEKWFYENRYKRVLMNFESSKKEEASKMHVAPTFRSLEKPNTPYLHVPMMNFIIAGEEEEKPNKP